MIDVAELTDEVTAKERALESILEDCAPVVVAYSGGVDSAYLLRVAHRVLGPRAKAFTARSPSLMALELDEAIALAEAMGVAHEIVDTDELGRSGYVTNDVDRCYFCKTELFDATAVAAGRFDAATVVDGFNLDDFGDHRPGHVAAEEHAVRHPLAEAQLTKSEIRALSRRLDLPTWNKPQLACLSSRVPYGTEVTEARLNRIEQVEVALRRNGFRDVRARLVADNDDMVRIEVGAAELPRLVEPATRDDVVAAARTVGFRFVTLDLEGFRSGRMNEGLVQLGGGPRTTRPT